MYVKYIHENQFPYLGKIHTSMYFLNQGYSYFSWDLKNELKSEICFYQTLKICFSLNIYSDLSPVLFSVKTWGQNMTLIYCS